MENLPFGSGLLRKAWEEAAELYTDTRKMLRRAREGGWAVGAFNVENMEMVQAVARAAEALRAPVILQTSQSTMKYMDFTLVVAMVRAEAARALVPVALHMDHGSREEVLLAALEGGYSSLMVDGSTLPFDENVALTRRIVEKAARMGVPVEAEIGAVGGKEDDHSATNQYTDPAEAERFAAETGCDSLAVAIGTAHGVYKGTPVLDTERLSAIAALVEAPLVLHGASGLTDEAAQACIRRGVAKVNFATELRIAFTGALRRSLEERPDAFDPKVHLGPAREAVEALVMARIRALGSEGKA